MSGIWDQEFLALTEDVKQLLKQASRAGDPHDFDTVADLRASVDERIGAFTVAHDRLSQVLRKKWDLSRAHGATVYWSKQYLVKMKLLLDEFLALQNRKMWLRLLQVRFSGAVGAEKSNLEARHLVDLVLRRQQLAKVEQGLREDLQAVGSQRQKLRDEYEKISAADENWLASVSMHGRLGVDVANAAQNPSTKALNDLLKVVAVPLRHPADETWLTNTSREVETKSQSLLEQCKLLAVGYVQKGNDSYDSNSLNKFKNAINQVKDLNIEITKKIEKLLSERIAPARPKLVQSASKQAKTEDRTVN
jgi:hypothetical protein